MLALDEKTGDLILGSTGAEQAKEGRFVIQQVRSRLQVVVGEWVLDPSIGWVDYTKLKKNFDRADIIRTARTIILETKGVLSIESLTSSYDPIERTLSIKVKASTLYGVIDLTVPWST